MNIVVRTPEEIIDLLSDVQTDALYAEGCSCGLNYDMDDGQKWIDWLTGKVEWY